MARQVAAGRRRSARNGAASSQGDPTLIDIPARIGTADVANLARLVTNANRVFDEIVRCTQTARLRQVFGALNVSRARV